MSDPFWFLLGGIFIGYAVGAVEDRTGWSWPFFAMTGIGCAYPLWRMVMG